MTRVTTNNCSYGSAIWFANGTSHNFTLPNGKNRTSPPCVRSRDGCCFGSMPLDPPVLWNNDTAKALPPGLFLICGDRAWQGIPQNALGGPCYIGRLSVLTINRTTLASISNNGSKTVRRRRSLQTLGPECGDEVRFWGLMARIFASVLPFFGTTHALKEIERLACWAVKQANETSDLLAELTTDVDGMRQAVVQNRAAINFLLLAQGHGCQDFKGMCCFNLSDHSESIHKRLQWLKAHTGRIMIQNDPLSDWLRNLFGNWGSWLIPVAEGFFLALIAVLILLMIIPCFIRCVSSCLEKILDAFRQRMEYHRIREAL
ncbi:uncharacterized protein LOC109369105 [Meleagris gallopavo]|uniref:uncharacterized protein LOC109369105 n=1 Tax=Meleagris gallopavo TaxID=9103 RepID=UPI00093F1EB4|nr:uncharacterized protein LOC109369105 [Meleagris gallopavo]